VIQRSAADLDLLSRRLGADLALVFPGPAGLFEDADLAATVDGPWRGSRDLATTSGVAAAEQLLVNRLMTRRGELAPLGHPDYGSRHHELVGQPNVGRTRNLVKLAVIEALSAEPRVEKILDVRVFAPHQPPRDEVRVEVGVRLIDHDDPMNLVVPFSLAVGAG